MAEQLQLFFTQHSQLRQRLETFNKLDRTNGYVKYGADNLYPEHILSIYYNSPFVSGIVGRMADYISGTEVYGAINGVESQEATDFLKTLNNGQGLHELIYRAAIDYLLFGGFCFQVVYSTVKMEDGTAEPAGAIDLVNQEWGMCRYGFAQKKDADGLTPRGVYIKNDWSKRNSGEDTAKFFLLYEYGVPSSEPRFLYFRDYTPGFSYYPRPIWSAAIRSAETEIEVINFKNANVQQCFAPGGVLEFPRDLDPEQREEAKRWFESQGKGTDNAGKLLVSFSLGGDGNPGVRFTPFTNSPVDKAASQVQEECQQEILTAFRVPSPLLIGLPGSGTLGGDGNTLAVAAKEWFSKVIEPMRSRILQQINMIIGDIGRPEIQVEVRLDTPDYGDSAAPAGF